MSSSNSAIKAMKRYKRRKLKEKLLYNLKVIRTKQPNMYKKEYKQRLKTLQDNPIDLSLNKMEPLSELLIWEFKENDKKEYFMLEKECNSP